MFLERVVDNLDKKADRVILIGKKDGKYIPLTFKDLKKRISVIQDNLPELNEEDRVVIFMENSPLWIASLFAIMFKGGIAVPADYLLSEKELFNIFRDSQPRYIITSSANKEKVRAAVRKLGYHPSIVIVDNLSFEEEKPLTVKIPDIEEVAVILYTSGTTGNPKGVMLTYKNLNHNIEGIEDTGVLRDDDRFAAILPFHHTYPLLVTALLPVVEGLPVVFIEKLTPNDILSTIRDQNVTIMVGVPKLYQVIYHNIMVEIGKLSGPKKKLVNSALKLFRKVGVKKLQKAVFKEVHRKIGPSLRFMISGGAKLNVEVAKGLEALGFNLLEGYGLTETSPLVSVNRPDKKKIGSAGPPIKGVEVKIVNGEIAVKGDNVMKGYYNRPEETEAVIRDGWFYTGDLGFIDDDGFIHITGRAKDVIVLDNGKNVYPEDIENEVFKSNYILEVGVFEDGGVIKAIIRPDFELLIEEGIEDIHEFIKQEIKKTTRHLQSYKKIKEFKITDRELPRTRIGKLRRFMLPDMYKEI
ncbi:AMP-binding protein [Desulfurobacterium sp.]|uniref:AMP-binding protein n=1 Tax=Desulfurobacterium sp. TaxID=2004706 RepID=UPI0026359018|nr:AMP-binding protein [Desulfurobacterium sp.]